MAAGVVAALVTGGFGFNYKKAHSISTSKSTITTYYYGEGVAYQRLEPGHVFELDLKERSIISRVFTDTNNWTLNVQCSLFVPDYTLYICSISFDVESTADGGSDGQLTLQEALNAVYAQYSASTPQTMQASYTVDGNAIVNVFAVDEAH